MWDTDDQHYSLKDLLSRQGNAAGVLQEKNVAVSTSLYGFFSADALSESFSLSTFCCF